MAVIDYTIKAIPTVYRGRRYRSRLVARWAAYFDLLGFNHEYEPCDFGHWSPDFALWVRRPNFPVFVEVKPIDDWHRETARKMSDACPMGTSDILLLGKQPTFSDGWEMFGWLGQPGQYETNWTEGLMTVDALGRFDVQPNGNDFCQETLLRETITQVSPCNTNYLWVEAGNLVQWHPRKGNK